MPATQHAELREQTVQMKDKDKTPPSLNRRRQIGAKSGRKKIVGITLCTKLTAESPDRGREGAGHEVPEGKMGQAIT